jgi:hypothetical protein
MAVSLGPNPIWASSYRDVSDNLAKLLVNGQLFTYRDVARSELKTTYQDAAGTIPWTNPISLDSSGSIPGPVYWALDEAYYLVWTDATQTQVIKTVEGYVPTTGAPTPPVTITQDFINFVENSDFRYFFKQKYLNGNLDHTAINSIAPRWEFERSNATGVYEIEFKEFAIGQTSILEGNPKYYFHMECGTAGTGQTVLTLRYTFTGVEQFQNVPVSFGIQGESSTTSTIEVVLVQHFGTGGTPSSDVDTVLMNQALTGTWAKYTSLNNNLPTIAGKTLGTNNDDALYLEIRFPLASIFDIDLQNFQINEGSTLPPYEYETTEMKIDKKNSLDFQNYSPDFYEDRYFAYTRTQMAPVGSPYATGGAMFTLDSPVPIGAIMFFAGLKATIPDGWLICEGQSIFKWQYLRLYAVLGTRYGGTHFFASRSAATVSVTNYDNGSVTDAIDVDTGLTITVTQQGTASLPEKTDIIAKAASLIPNGSSFLIHSIYTAFTVWFDIDFTGVRPTITGVEIKVNITSTNTADEVAEAMLTAMNPAGFRVPDCRGYFPRFMDDGAGRDPDAGTRTPTLGGDTDVGTTQADEFKSHIHTLSTKKQLNSADGAQNRIDPYGALATTPVTLNINPTGGAETRALNIGFYGIIRY